MDNASCAGVSETDHMLFTVLSNSERVDMSSLNRETRSESPPRIVEVPEEATPPPPLQDTVAHEGDFASRSLDPETAAPPPLHEPLPSPPPIFAPPIFAPPEAPPPEAAPPEAAATPPDVRPCDEHAPDNDEEKRTTLMDLQQLKIVHGVTLTKEWSMDDRLEDMMLEVRRHTLALDERSNVNMMRDGLKMLVTGMEVVNQRLGLLDLEGWSTEVCRDINKHDANLSRVYRRYWRRSTSNSPEVEIVMSLMGSMGFYHMKKTVTKHVIGRGKQKAGFSRRRAPTPPSSDDEEAPPR